MRQRVNSSFNIDEDAVLNTSMHGVIEVKLHDSGASELGRSGSGLFTSTLVRNSSGNNLTLRVSEGNFSSNNTLSRLHQQRNYVDIASLEARLSVMEGRDRATSLSDSMHGYNSSENNLTLRASEGSFSSNNNLSRLHQQRNSVDIALLEARLSVIEGRDRATSLSDSMHGYSLLASSNPNPNLNSAATNSSIHLFQQPRPYEDVELVRLVGGPATRGGGGGGSLKRSSGSSGSLESSGFSSSQTDVAASAANLGGTAASTVVQLQLQPQPGWAQTARQVISEIVLSGDMPRWKAFVLRNHRHNFLLYLLFWLDVVLRGVSQVYLCDHPVSGVLILLGLVCTSGSLAAMALLGTLCSTLGAHLVCRPPLDDITSGLCGYDGALVGCACWAFLDFQALPGKAAAVAVVLSAASGVMHVALTNLLKTFNLPTFTFAFNVTTIAFLLSLKTNNAGTMPLAPPSPLPSYPPAYIDLNWAFMWDASVRGVGQFMFSDTTPGGILVILGIAISSRVGALAAWGGATVAAITAVQLLAVSSANRVDVRNGLYGYNSAGTCASLAGGIFFDPSLSGAVFGIIGAALAVLILGMFKALLGTLFGLPVLTFPFIVSTWIMLLTQSKLLVPYPAMGSIVRFEAKLWNALTQPPPWLAGVSGEGLLAVGLAAVTRFLSDQLLFPTVHVSSNEFGEDNDNNDDDGHKLV